MESKIKRRASWGGVILLAVISLSILAVKAETVGWINDGLTVSTVSRSDSLSANDAVSFDYLRFNTIQRLGAVTGVNFKTTGQSIIVTNPTYVTYPTHAVVILTGASGITNQPQIGIGTASPWNEILVNTTLNAGMNQATRYQVIPVVVATSTAAGTNIQLNVQSAAIGTTYTGTVELYGYMIP